MAANVVEKAVSAENVPSSAAKPRYGPLTSIGYDIR